jgi:hypothetical protein
MAATGNDRKPGWRTTIPKQIIAFERLGLGAMTHPETVSWIARVVLFEYMRTMVRGGLRKLQDKCSPLYRALHDLGCKTLPLVRSDFPALVIRDVISEHARSERTVYVENWALLCEAAKQYAEANELVNALSVWAGARHMMVDWFLDAVLMNLLTWRRDSEAEKDLHWFYPGSMAVGDNHRAGIDAQRLHGRGTIESAIPVPVVRPYNPSMQTRKEHQQEVESALGCYYDKQEEYFAANGFEKTTPKRARTIRNQPWLHFEWFILYQMREWPGSKIADEYTVRGDRALSESGIHRALGDLAVLLGVPLRPQVTATERRLKKKKLNS